MAARINTICDAVADAIEAWWASATPAMGAADSVVRDYQPDIGPDQPQEENSRPVGRRVYVFPDASTHHGAATRGEDDDEHAVVVAVEEWYPEAGKPPRAWMDARVLFTESLWKVLRDARTDVVAGSRPESAEVTDWFDVGMLVTNRAYLGFVRVSYREFADPDPGE